MDKFIISAGIKLKINFDKNAKLEIYDEHKRWREVSPEVFRSWTGERKVNGKTYEGPIYIWLSNHIYESRISLKSLLKEGRYRGATIETHILDDLKKHGKVKGNPTGAYVLYKGK